MIMNDKARPSSTFYPALHKMRFDIIYWNIDEEGIYKSSLVGIVWTTPDLYSRQLSLSSIIVLLCVIWKFHPALSFPSFICARAVSREAGFQPDSLDEFPLLWWVWFCVSIQQYPKITIQEDETSFGTVFTTVVVIITLSAVDFTTYDN